ncbi:hypothetical protein D3C71_1764480 [compost metagenome]
MVAVVLVANRGHLGIGQRAGTDMQGMAIQRQFGWRAPPGDQVGPAPEQIADGWQGQEEHQPHRAIAQHLDQQAARQQPDVQRGQQLGAEQVKQGECAGVAAQRITRQNTGIRGGHRQGAATRHRRKMKGLEL